MRLRVLILPDVRNCTLKARKGNNETMRILLSGSHGLVGTALRARLEEEGHKVISLVRYTPSYDSEEIEWNPERYSIALAQLEGFDSVIHLAGESIAEGRWTEEKKRRIRDSRIRGTQLLAETLSSLKARPASFLCASAIGFYGNRADQILTEESSAGSDFLAGVCVDWEKACVEAAQKNVRVCNLRFGVILDAQEGALAKMLPPFRMGIGGKIGTGRQWMSWIALADVISAITFLLAEQGISGPVNVVAPNPVTNAEFSKTLGKTLSRPTFFAVPAFGARLAFGEMADALLLSSQRVLPTRLQEATFHFEYPKLEHALREILKP